MAVLSGRTALVTGGARGIGAAIARQLAEAGARVGLVGRDEAALRKAAAALPGDAVPIAADLAEPGAAHAVLRRALEELGGLDVLVNNAGVSYHGSSDTLTEAAADTVWALNVRAPLLLAGAAAGHMAQRGAGSIVNISSALAARGNGGTSLYAASKGAIDAATRALAAEWGPRGVRVNTVRPGVTRSDMTEPLVANEAVLATLLRSIPLGRVGDAEDIAAVVVFLAGDASAYLTGQILDADGGWSATARSIRDAS